MNIKRKKRLYLAALSIAGMISLSSCGYKNQMSEKDKLKYFQKIDHDYKDKDNITYEIVSNLKVCFLTNTNSVYITFDIYGDNYDYFTGAKIQSYDYDNDSVLQKNYDISFFLEKYDLIKEEYSDNDLKELLTLIKNDYEVTLNKDMNKRLSISYSLKKKGMNKYE